MAVPINLTWAGRVENEQGRADNLASKDAKSQLQPFAQVIKDTDKLEGLFTLYRHKERENLPGTQAGQLNKTTSAP